MSKDKTDQAGDSQAERFKRTAREHGVELDEKKLAETLRRMTRREKAKKDGEQDEN